MWGRWEERDHVEKSPEFNEHEAIAYKYIINGRAGKCRSNLTRKDYFSMCACPLSGYHLKL